MTASPGASPSSVPAAFRNTSGLVRSDADVLAAAAAVADPAVLAASWRTNVSFRVLDPVPDADWAADTASAAVAWEPFTDTASGVAAVAYCFGSEPFACDVVGYTPVALGPTSSQARVMVDFALSRGLRIASGTTVYGTVAAVNHVGMATLVTTDGILVDDRPPALDRVLDTGRYFLHPDALPTGGTVLYRPPLDVDCDVEGEGVGASWRDVATGAGVGYYEWAVGSCANCTDILGWTNVGQAVAVYNSTVFVPAGAIYFTSVRATGVTGARAHGFSDGVRVLRPAEAAERMLCLALPV